MPRSAERGGPQTRARIASVAAELFLDRGFDLVTVADVAREAGVSSVTVFKHFPRKEDLYLDRSVEAVELLRSAVHDRADGMDVLASLRALVDRLADEQHPLSGLNARSAPFFRTVAASPALIARAREIAAELQSTLAQDLHRDSEFDGHASLLAAFFLAGYGTVLAETAQAVIDGVDEPTVARDHRARLDRLFVALTRGVAAAS